MSIKIGILGATGYTGAELLRLLISHQSVDISWLTSEKFSDQNISSVFPQFEGLLDILCSSVTELNKQPKVDLVFSCLPHGTSSRFVSKFLQAGSRVVDFSRDFRFRDGAFYKKLFSESHKFEQYLKDSEYGLPELNREKIRDASLVANPGCYATAVILGLLPLAEKGILGADVIADIKSGISGAGRAPTLSHHFSEVNESLFSSPDSVRDQQGEIEYKIAEITDLPANVTFVPHTVPINRGILATIYCRMEKEINPDTVYEIFRERYIEEKFISILDSGKLPGVKDVTYSNMCRIGLAVRDNMIIVVTALDNLGKGASGQAVQNMNIMFGFTEQEGLQTPPTYP